MTVNLNNQMMPLDVIAFLKVLKNSGVLVSEMKGELKVAVSKNSKVDPALIEEIRNNKIEILKFLKDNTQSSLSDHHTDIIAVRSRDMAGQAKSPLSFQQERIWFLNYLHGGSEAYHIPVVLKIDGKCDSRRIEDSFRALISRHESLRTVFLEEGGQVFQQVIDGQFWSLRYTKRDNEFSETQLNEYIDELVLFPFDLSRDYMIRAELIELSKNDFRLILIVHHIACDGWSMLLLMKEFLSIYNLEKQTGEYPFTPVEISYTDFAVWQRQRFGDTHVNDSETYWVKYLDGIKYLELPTDYQKTNNASNVGESILLKIDSSLHNQLVEFSKEESATLFMVLLSVFKVFLFKYTGQSDIAIGTVMANRNNPDTHPLVGFFANTIVARSNIKPNETFKSYLAQVKNTVLEVADNQSFPFEKVVEISGVERNLSYNPMFQVAFLMQDIDVKKKFQVNDASITIEHYHSKRSKFDLSFEALLMDSDLYIRIEYNKNLFNKGTVKRMSGYYTRLLESLSANSNQIIEDISLLDDNDTESLKDILSNTQKVKETDGDSIISLFERQVRFRPDRIAVECDGMGITYTELNSRANQLANYLRQKGVEANQLVPVFIDRSVDMVVAILAILKSGGGYVPIDVTYPKERIDYILKDTNACIVLTTYLYKDLISHENVKDIIVLDECDHLLRKFSGSNLDIHIEGNSAIYVIYTSGSTGYPKGVLNEHNGVLNRLLWAIEYFAVIDSDVFLQKTTYCFDVSVWEIFCPILTGCKLVLAKTGEQSNPQYIKDVIREKKVTILHFVPSMLEAFLSDNNTDDCSSVTRVLCSGEHLTPSVINAFKKKYNFIKLYNLYGPTEAAIDVTCWEVPQQNEVSFTCIGTPISGVHLYILDKNRCPVPMGIPGELYIGGIQVARGYLNSPDLTVNTFIKNRMEDKLSPVLYATGDIVSLNGDGSIKCIGRKDDQVKIRGYRIELDEIKERILQSRLVKQAVVLVKKNSHDQLICFVVLKEAKEKKDLIKYLQDTLPAYMIPGIIVALDSIPFTANGKIDKDSLLKYNVSPHGNTDSLTDDPITNVIKGIWEEVLGIEGIGLHSNFFEVGGDSIMTIRIVNKIRNIGFDIQAKDIFTSQTIASLAATIRSREKNKIAKKDITLRGQCGLLPIQQWFLNNQPPEYLSHFNQSVLLEVKKNIPHSILENALTILVNYHDALRFKYERTERNWAQYYNSGSKLDLVTENLSSIENTSELIFKMSALCDGWQQSLNIYEGKLIQPVLFLTNNTFTNNRLLIIVHHLAVDAVSWHIILEDIEKLLNVLVQNETVSLIGKTSSYRDWYDKITDYYTSEVLVLQKDYWYNVARNNYKLNYDYNVFNDPIKIKHTSVYETNLGKDKTRQLLYDVSRAYQTEINDILLTALTMALCEWTDRGHVVIGLESHGREAVFIDEDVSHTVGWFTTLYPLLLNKVSDGKLSSWMKSIKEQIRKVPDKGIGYGVLKYVLGESGLVDDAPFEIMFNYLGQSDTIINRSNFFSRASEPIGVNVNEELHVSAKVTINCIIKDEDLVFSYRYSNKHFQQNTIEGLAAAITEKLKMLIDHCVNIKPSRKGATPSDYGLGADVSYSELDKFLQDGSENDIIMEF